MTVLDFVSLTWPDASLLGKREDVIGLIPVGAVEQHGPHLPLSTDILIAAELARRIGRSVLEQVVVAPVMPGGLSKHHLEFPGTVHLPEPMFEGALTAYVEAFARIGIRKVAIFSSHGGNFAFLGRYPANEPRDDVELVVAWRACRVSGICGGIGHAGGNR